MNHQQINSEFSAKAGERILEIFLLSDAARKEFKKIQEQGAREEARLHDELQARRAEDLGTAKREISTERPKPELAPPWRLRRDKRHKADLQASAEHLVYARNAVIVNALTHKHREREDAFLSHHREERLLREAQENHASRDRPSSPSLTRDFEQSR
ncbi:hypothetical protein [Allopusillimonas ginsengisoli]|uniref:hypothetical protein n=1 Tax=Allopusillimonas ginsengisoli TaxID=453575 RepID=UPI0010205825|nr:hypothetical protein [Allopusillimonas ginsengisoli]TEA79187.1 hypothetical protein ERE07_07320 [Allopusillimonas ginsengisoli]